MVRLVTSYGITDGLETWHPRSAKSGGRNNAQYYLLERRVCARKGK